MGTKADMPWAKGFLGVPCSFVCILQTFVTEQILKVKIICIKKNIQKKYNFI